MLLHSDSAPLSIYGLCFRFLTDRAKHQHEEFGSKFLNAVCTPTVLRTLRNTFVSCGAACRAHHNPAVSECLLLRDLIVVPARSVELREDILPASVGFGKGLERDLSLGNQRDARWH